MSRTLECRLMKLSGEFLYQELSRISLQLKPRALLKTHGHLNSAEKPLPKTHTAILQTASTFILHFYMLPRQFHSRLPLKILPNTIEMHSIPVPRIIEIGNIRISKRLINEGKSTEVCVYLLFIDNFKKFVYQQYIIKVKILNFSIIFFSKHRNFSQSLF